MGMRAGAPVDTSEGRANVGGAVLASSGTEHNAGGDGRLQTKDCSPP